jgi:hypothetical protein
VFKVIDDESIPLTMAKNVNDKKILSHLISIVRRHIFIIVQDYAICKAVEVFF